jgi:hypothetical protein
MRQASWIAFLFLAIGLATYEASVDQTAEGPGEPTALDGGASFPPGPKP